MGTILVKSALNALKFEAFKALFTKIVPIFCELILEFW
jgi:hypothetical protein